MTDTLKQFVEWVTASNQSEFTKARLRLTAYYVVSTFFILFVSSIAILVLFTPTVPPQIPATTLPYFTDSDTVAVHESWSLVEFREHLPSVLAVADMVVLIFVSMLSYFFAGRTLRPIEETYRRQEQFVGDVAHELRTPLSVMKAGGSAILRKDHTTHEYRTYITDMNEEVDRLTRLTNQLLLLLSAQTPKEATHISVDVSDLATRVVKRYQGYAEEHGVVLTVEAQSGVSVAVSSDDLTQILQNLIKNAIDYNRKGGTVVVSIQSTQRKAEIVVADTGIGMEPAVVPRVFDRFYKADTARSQDATSGTGLGLSVVSELVQTHGGTIDIASAPGEGTTIALTFPLHFSS